MARLIHHQKPHAQQSDHHTRHNMLEAPIHKLQTFPLGKERDAELLEQEFARWKQMNELNVRKSRKELGPSLARVPDGAAIKELVLARQLKHELIAEKSSGPNFKSEGHTALFAKGTKEVRRGTSSSKSQQRRTKF